MRLSILFLVLTGLPAFAQQKPDNIPVSTWVREDLFAGFLVNDMVQFEKGVSKLNAVLVEKPNAVDALAWRGGVEIYRAVRAYEAGDAKQFDHWYRNAQATFDKARALPPAGIALQAIEGGSYMTLGDRLPPAERRKAYERAYEQYKSMQSIQAKFFDKMPVHFRGETLAGLAQAAQRLGKEEEAKQYMQQIVAALPGTPYETRVKLWMEKPETIGTTKAACQTCHDAGRLQNVLAAKAQQQ